MKRIKRVFKFQPFSKKQRMVLNWWCKDSPVKDSDGIIADGAIRSGKTVSMSLSFIMWAMSSFNGENFAMCGKTIGSFRRNVLSGLKMMLHSRGYTVADHRADNLVIITKGLSPFIVRPEAACSISELMLIVWIAVGVFHKAHSCSNFAGKLIGDSSYDFKSYAS